VWKPEQGKLANFAVAVVVWELKVVIMKCNFSPEHTTMLQLSYIQRAFRFPNSYPLSCLLTIPFFVPASQPPPHRSNSLIHRQRACNKNEKERNATGVAYPVVGIIGIFQSFLGALGYHTVSGRDNIRMKLFEPRKRNAANANPEGVMDGYARIRCT
jgi:hypothetical protein